MENGAYFELEQREDGSTDLVLSGQYLVNTVGEIDQDIRDLDETIARIDLSSVGSIDTIGAWLTASLARKHEAEIIGADQRAQTLIDAVNVGGETVEIAPPREPVFERVPREIGALAMEMAKGSVHVIAFLGAILAGVASLLRRPSRFPMTALVRQIELVGVSALPIIGLMSFLIGIVIAQQGAVQLAQFGAEQLTINLVGRISLRELGVLMTAIMVAGRSGSAFAAQIGTMKLTEEVDAMRTIGISPVEALVIPRILAAVFMMPLLGFYAALMAILGGAAISDLTLDIPFMTFLARIQEVVPAHDLWVGLIKAPVFGLIVALTGCYQGMCVSGNSEEVGSRTTKAVVQAIFAVIVLDAFFAVFFTEVGWG